MAMIAYGCIELQADGRWICRRSSSIQGRYGSVDVSAGQVFAAHSSFAGFSDFTVHLAEIAVEQADKPPHEWT